MSECAYEALFHKYFDQFASVELGYDAEVFVTIGG